MLVTVFVVVPLLPARLVSISSGSSPSNAHATPSGDPASSSGASATPSCAPASSSGASATPSGALASSSGAPTALLDAAPTSGNAEAYIAPKADCFENLPSFGASIIGPLAAIIVLAMRPICGIVIDPMIALPIGGLVTLAATRSLRAMTESLDYGLSKMAPVALLLVGTGTLAGVISASDMKEVVISWLEDWNVGGRLMAPFSSILMAAATASTTAGATIASASFADAVLETGLAGVWAASLTNAGATVLDHLPHGSFFHATAGSVAMPFKQRLILIPFESLVGLTLTIATLLCSYLPLF